MLHYGKTVEKIKAGAYGKVTEEHFDLEVHSSLTGYTKIGSYQTEYNALNIWSFDIPAGKTIVFGDTLTAKNVIISVEA